MIRRHVPLAFAALLGAAAVHLVDAAVAADTPGRARMCKVFKHGLEGSGVVDTHDRTTEVGQWVAGQTGSGWSVADVDFEITQKQNGFPQAFVQVCLVR